MESRRTFFKVAISAIAVFFIFLWNKLTLHHITVSSGKQHTFPFNRNKTVAFNDEFIIVSKPEPRVFSAHCTHLGCKIDKMEGDKFVCPCHGSEYSMDGKVLKGPAYRDLTELSAQISEDGANITIER